MSPNGYRHNGFVVTVHHVPKCMSSHKGIVVITERVHCFMIAYIIYIYIYIYIYDWVFNFQQIRISVTYIYCCKTACLHAFSIVRPMYVRLYVANTKSVQITSLLTREKNRRMWDQGTHRGLISQQVRMRLHHPNWCDVHHPNWSDVSILCISRAQILLSHYYACYTT